MVSAGAAAASTTNSYGGGIEGFPGAGWWSRPALEEFLGLERDSNTRLPAATERRGG